MKYLHNLSVPGHEHIYIGRIARVKGHFLDVYKRQILVSALVAIAGFSGDVVISAIKRDKGIKDMGNSIPGHGGVFDRIDSLSYTAPVFFHK